MASSEGTGNAATLEVEEMCASLDVTKFSKSFVLLEAPAMEVEPWGVFYNVRLKHD